MLSVIKMCKEPPSKPSTLTVIKMCKEPRSKPSTNLNGCLGYHAQKNRNKEEGENCVGL